MKKISLFLVVSMLLLTSLSAQNNKVKFAFGLYTDVVSIPITEKSLQSNLTTAFVSVYPIDKLHFKLGVGNNLLLENEFKKYQLMPELMLGAGYTVYQKGIVSNDISLSVANAFQKFGEFQDFHADLSYRFKLVDAFFVGAGFRYQHQNANELLVKPSDGLTFFMELGFDLNIGKKPKALQN